MRPLPEERLLHPGAEHHGYVWATFEDGYWHWHADCECGRVFDEQHTALDQVGVVTAHVQASRLRLVVA